jgi:hypothetical protein
MTTGVPALLRAAWLEPVTLQLALARAERLSDDARVRTTPWVLAAQSRFRVARELRDLEAQPVALALLREAAFFALSALEQAESRSEAGSGSPERLWARFNAVELGLSDSPPQLERVRAVFAAADPLAIDRMRADEMQKFRGLAEGCVGWLLALAEIRTLPQLRRARVVRSLLAVAASLVLLSGLVAYWLSLANLTRR